MGGGRLRRHHGREDWQPYGITDGANERPIISQVAVRGDTVYVYGVTPDAVGDITSQTQQVLNRIDALLRQVSTDKSKLLTARVWLADMRLFEAHDAMWNASVDPQNPPVRACVRADLVCPCLVEITVTAAR